jgi:hypothetical protein
MADYDRSQPKWFGHVLWRSTCALQARSKKGSFRRLQAVIVLLILFITIWGGVNPGLA